MSKYALDLEKYAALARHTQAGGCVLLENRNKTLPLRAGDKIAVFGRTAFNYYNSQSAYQRRNEWMVDRSSLLIAAYTGVSGGMSNPIEYAQKQAGCRIQYLSLGGVR